MRHKRHLILAALALGVLVAVPTLAAFGLETAAGDKIPKTKDLAVIIGRILSAVLGFVGTLFLLLMVYAGFLWMTAGGDSSKVDKAKQLITAAVIGVVIIASAYAITNFVLTSVTADAQQQSETTAEEPAEGPSCTASCTMPLDCGGLADSCGICSSCKCADGSLSTNNNPCPSTGSCLCH
jgi:hypothetical protein